MSDSSRGGTSGANAGALSDAAAMASWGPAAFPPPNTPAPARRRALRSCPSGAGVSNCHDSVRVACAFLPPAAPVRIEGTPSPRGMTVMQTPFCPTSNRGATLLPLLEAAAVVVAAAVVAVVEEVLLLSRADSGLLLPPVRGRTVADVVAGRALCTLPARPPALDTARLAPIDVAGRCGRLWCGRCESTVLMVPLITYVLYACVCVGGGGSCRKRYVYEYTQNMHVRL